MRQGAGGAGGWAIKPLGDLDLLVEFGGEIDPATNQRVHAAARALGRLREHWDIQIVPAYTALAIMHRARHVRGGPNPFSALQEAVEAVLAEGFDAVEEPGRIVDIPVCYGGDHGPDLEDVARQTGLDPQEVIELHAADSQRVFMVGFAPGQPVIGLSDERLSLPRRRTPRVRVPARSVAIANRQTVAYSMAVPGGWHLLGRTPIAPFRIGRDPLCYFMAGDRVRFRPIDEDEFQSLEAAHGA